MCDALCWLQVTVSLKSPHTWQYKPLGLRDSAPLPTLCFAYIGTRLAFRVPAWAHITVERKQMYHYMDLNSFILKR
jgi:hypothetical protein